LQTLFGTERAEAIRVLLTTELTNCVADSRSDTINTLKAELANLSDRHAMLVEEQRKQSVDLLPLETVASLKTTIQRSDSYALAKEALSGAELKLASYRSQFEEARDLKNKKMVELGLLEEALNDTRKDYESSKFRLASVDSARKTNATRKQLEELIAARKAMLSKPAPEDPSKVDFSELNRLSRELREVEEKLSQWRSFLRTFSDSKVDASCPTCFQSVTASSIEAIKRAIDESVPIHDRLAADVGLQEASRRHMTEAFESHKRNVEMAQTTLVQLEGQLAGLPEVVNIDESSLEGMRSLIEMFTSTERQQNIVRHGVSVQTERERNMFSSMTNAALEVDLLLSRMQQAPDPAEVEKAQRKLQQHEEGRVQAARLEGEAKQVSERMSQVRLLLEQRELEEKRLGGVKQYREMCERAKTLLHRDNLPNLVGQAYMKAINTHLAHYLEAFDVPFRARMMEDNSMVCNFGDTEVPAGRLSGGQRVALGLTWRFAVYNLFVNNLGLLILDEPTVYLDKERIDSVYRLLEQVKTYSKAADLQLLVVTHEERLAGVFDQVIKL
jgi:exonuclease SbcC